MHIEGKEFVRSRLKDSAFTLFWSYNHNSKINLTKNEPLLLNNLSNNKNTIIQKSDKDNGLLQELFFLTKINTLNECPKY